MSVLPKNPDPRRCPLCGDLNACGIAAGEKNCWCFTELVSPEILKKIPAGARGTLTIFFSHYNSCAVFYALRRQGRPVKIRRGPATVMATKAATQVTVLS